MQATFDEAREYVLNVVANDYESLDMVIAEVSEWANEEGKRLNTPAITEALFSLVDDGLIDCFVYRPEKSCYERSSVNKNRGGEYWYYVSELGKRSLT